MGKQFLGFSGINKPCHPLVLSPTGILKPHGAIVHTCEDSTFIRWASSHRMSKSPFKLVTTPTWSRG